MKNRKLKTSCIVITTAMLLSLTGCGSSDSESYIEPTIPEYTKQSFETTELQKGDLHPEFEVVIEAPECERITYYPSYDGMIIDKVYVSEGDVVKKGDILITFESENFDEEIEKYTSNISQNQILIEHYSRLASINPGVDYSQDIAALQNDIDVSNMYISELNKKKDAYTIKAEKDGSVGRITDTAKMAMVGGTHLEVNSNTNLISVDYGDGVFVGETTENYDFEVGQQYMAVSGVSEYPVELTDIEEEGKNKVMTFKGCDSNVNYTRVQNAKIVFEKPVLNNVSYIDKNCIFELDGKQCVYILDEKGFREIREVEVEQEVDGYLVIKSGIESGEKVVIN